VDGREGGLHLEIRDLARLTAPYHKQAELNSVALVRE
jgi:hypothetical protein